jgi:hypothetical protein
VPAMKVTVSAAMRARDVSRPRADQLDEAEAAEASIPSGPRANVTAAGTARGDEARDAAQVSTGRRNAARDGEWGAWASEPEKDGRAAAPGDREERAGGRPEGTRKRRLPRDSPRRGRAGR